MKCPNEECRSKNPRHATHCARCGEELPERWSRFKGLFSTALGWLLFLLLIATGVKPLDTKRRAHDQIETLAYVVLYAQDGDPAIRADMAERIPELRRLYGKQPRDFRESLDHSLTAFIELLDAVMHDMMEDIEQRGVVNLDKSEIARRHRTIYDAATKYDGLRAVLDANILDLAEYGSMLSLEDIKRTIILDQSDSILKHWKDGALQTKDRILR